MKFKHSDNVLEGPTSASIVVQMREQSFERTRTIRDYMVQVAERTKVMTGKEVRINTLNNFIDDLVKAGMLERID
jgi:metal-dependent amidase/aminoacylase/carboxypeptidase family protein